jgi:hypothetical protein
MCWLLRYCRRISHFPALIALSDIPLQSAIPFTPCSLYAVGATVRGHQEIIVSPTAQQ